MKPKLLKSMLLLGWFCWQTSRLAAQTFDFNDGTTQGWTLDQMYVTATNVKFTPVIGYTLLNANNDLAAYTGSLLIGRSDQNDIYLESPDLSSNSSWQGIGGYSIDVKRLLYSPCWGDFANIFYVQLQIRVIDTADGNKVKLFAEHDGTNFVFHDITTYGQLYQFTWKPSWLSDPKYTVKQIRIRITGPGDVAAECWYRGSWNIDNVEAESGTTPSQSITILEPNGGEKWYVGSEHEVWWQGQNFTDPVKIEYSTNGGSNWKTIASSTTNQIFPWTIPDEPSTNCLVRVADAADGSPSDVSDAQFTILKAGLTLTAPNGGEVWQIDSEQQITWSSQNIPDNDVLIELSTDNGATYSYVGYHTNNESSESFDWTVPNSPSTQCRIRISLYMQGAQVEDVSNATFTIASQPQASLTLTSPNGGESWATGSNHNITWTSQNFSGSVKIEYSTDGGAAYKGIVSSTANDGSHSWTIPNDPSTNCLVKISDAADGAPSDVSNAVFTISATANTPPGNNVEVNVGNGIKVTFDQVINSGETTLEVKTDGPAPPSGFKIIPPGSPVYFDIGTTATFTGNIKMDIPYNPSGMTPAEEANLRLYVYETLPGQWQDITILPVDTNNNIIGGSVTHLTLFAIMLGPVHFTFKSPTQDSYSIVIDNATLDGIQLTNGDEIGVFTPAGLCVGASVWDGNTPLALTAWADDSQTPEVDGYKSGDKMGFKIWDASAGAANDYAATPTYSAGNGNFGDGAFAHISLLKAETSVTRALSLPQGWSWISVNVKPENLAMDNVMAGVSNLAIVVNNAGKFYIPNVINTIGQLNVLEGYKIYVKALDQLSITGKPVDPATPIDMSAGWNFVSYLPTLSMPAEFALASVISKLAIIKNDDGKFFIPGLINSLGNMAPGEGYRLYLNANATLVYPQSMSPAKANLNTPVTQDLRARHFTFRPGTGESFGVVVKSPNYANKQLRSGDEIGIFTPKGICVGVGVWNGNQVVGIAAWADDERTETVDGFRAGEAMSFRLWDAQQQREFPIVAVFTNGVDKFGDGAFALVELEGAMAPTNFSLAQNYPNPFNAGTVITFNLPVAAKVELNVYNLLGKAIKTLLSEEKPAGSYSIL